MSQIYKPLTSGGPIPPNIPTQFNTQNGNAVPSANILIVNGFDSIENNNNGIITKGGVVGTGTSNEVDVVLTNRIVITASTANATPTTSNIFTPSPSTGLTFTVAVTGYDSTGNAITGGEIVGVATCSSLGVVLVVGTNDTFDEASPSLITADWKVITDGTQLQMEFTGVAATNISWTALFQYIQAPSP